MEDLISPERPRALSFAGPRRRARAGSDQPTASAAPAAR